MEKSKKKPQTTQHFEKNIETLENLISTMEKGDSSLEESLTNFEKGVSLLRNCQETLTQAEQKVQILTKENSLKNYATEVSDVSNEVNSDE